MTLFIWKAFFLLLVTGLAEPSSILKNKCVQQPNSFSDLQISCPGPEDPSDLTECCQRTDTVGKVTAYCCHPLSKSFDSLHDLEPLPKPEEAKLIRGVAKLIGVALGIIAFIVLVCLICCCCCPFCLLAKRRQRGHVIRQNATQQPQGGVPMMSPQATNPPAPQGYPPSQPNQPYYPNQGYPAQGYQGGGYGPPMDQPPPYPGPPLQDVGSPAEYAKPPAYNPNAASAPHQ